MPRILAWRVLAARAFIDGIHPDLFAGGAVQADHVAARTGGAIQLALDEQRRAFIDIFRPRPQRIGLEPPRDFEVVEISGIDLVQRRVTRIGKIIGVIAPFRVWRVAARTPRRLRPPGQAGS